MKNCALLISLLIALSSFSFSQTLSWKPTKKSASISLSADSTHIKSFNLLQPSSAFLPSYAKKNPSGYSYLCRLELKIEDKLAVPMWIKLGDKSPSMNLPGNQAYVRFKLKRF